MPRSSKKKLLKLRDTKNKRGSKPSNIVLFQKKEPLSGSLTKELMNKGIEVEGSLLPSRMRRKWWLPEDLKIESKKQTLRGDRIISKQQLVEKMMRSFPTPRFYGHDKPSKKKKK